MSGKQVQAYSVAFKTAENQFLVLFKRLFVIDDDPRLLILHVLLPRLIQSHVIVILIHSHPRCAVQYSHSLLIVYLALDQTVSSVAARLGQTLSNTESGLPILVLHSCLSRSELNVSVKVGRPTHYRGEPRRPLSSSRPAPSRAQGHGAFRGADQPAINDFFLSFFIFIFVLLIS